MDGQHNGGAGTGPRGQLECRTAAKGVTALLAAALVAVAGASGAQAAPPGWQEVVVTGPDGADGAAQVVERVGGEVVAELPVVSGVAARLPLGAALPKRWTVTPQRAMTTAATTDPGTAGTTDGVPAPAGPVSTVRQTLGLPADGSEGAGITVAVMDTGVADVPDLAGRVSDRVDITGGKGGDGHGHGTFMASLVAGSGAASGGAYRGVAPRADIVDVKVADEDGSTDLITVLRGLQWVDDHRRDVQVLNLSLSSGSPLPYQVDPLTQALEALWRKGVVVVVPSGNTGPAAGTLTSPGNDPNLLTVAGLDDVGTGARTDDVVAGWSGRGRAGGQARPDLAAPGASLIGLLAPDSVIAATYPHARIGDAHVRGSGTSMSTAVTSGVVAAVLARRPALKPDAVTGLLTSTAYTSTGLSAAHEAGAGGLDAARALAAAPSFRHAATRSGRDRAGVAADGRHWHDIDAAIRAGDGAAATKAWTKLSVEAKAWAARAWVDLDDDTRAWAARAWVSKSWTSGRWTGAEGTDEEWAARAWVARAWVGEDWAARAWVSEDWAARAWVGEDWAARAWVGEDWAARAWASDRWSARAWTWLPSLR